jgi:uncharacterized protein (UPF0147 family)
MARSKFLQEIIDETPKAVRRKVRQYADALKNKKKNNEQVNCAHCKCQDLEDWLNCHNKK